MIVILNIFKRLRASIVGNWLGLIIYKTGIALWFWLGVKLFDYFTIHTDRATSNCYAFTFSKDKQWFDRAKEDME